MAYSTLVLLRHGQSVWNQKNLFTGFVDIGLSEQGVKEAEHARDLLKNLKFKAVFVSALQRAKDTARIVLGDKKPELYREDKALNERSYGDLEGKNKDECRKIYGLEQVELWRRSFDKAPPGGESLKNTCERVLPFFKAEIWPRLMAGETVLVSAHGNSLRALVKYLENLTDDEIVKVEIPTGVPIVYELDEHGAIKAKRVLSASV